MIEVERERAAIVDPDGAGGAVDVGDVELLARVLVLGGLEGPVRDRAGIQKHATRLELVDDSLVLILLRPGFVHVQGQVGLRTALRGRRVMQHAHAAAAHRPVKGHLLLSVRQLRKQSLELVHVPFHERLVSFRQPLVVDLRERHGLVHEPRTVDIGPRVRARRARGISSRRLPRRVQIAVARRPRARRRAGRLRIGSARGVGAARGIAPPRRVAALGDGRSRCHGRLRRLGRRSRDIVTGLLSTFAAESRSCRG